MQVWTLTFLANWMMPAIFVVSGASLFFALGGSNGKFIKDKVLRLLVPLVVGAFTHVAMQVYLERVSHHQFTGTFFEFFAGALQRLMALAATSPGWGCTCGICWSCSRSASFCCRCSAGLRVAERAP